MAVRDRPPWLLEATRAGLFERRVDVPDLPEPLVDHEAKMDLERAFASLEFIDREALMFVDVLGFTPTEAAELVDIAPEAFRMRLHRARRRLRERYGDA